MLEESYIDFPPVSKLKKVLQFIPRTAFLYIQLFESCKKKKVPSFKKSSIKKKFFVSETLFRNHLHELRGLGILKFEEKTESFWVIIDEKYDQKV